MQPARLPSRAGTPWFRRQRRLSRRLAAGMRPAHAARAEGLPEAEIQAMLAEPDFAALVEAYRRLQSLDATARLARLESLAFDVLEEAMADGDTRVALFILGERLEGRNPAHTIAERVAKACEAAATPPRPKAAPRPRRSRPYDPVLAALRRGAARACLLLAVEHEVRAAVAEAPAKPATPAPAPPVTAAQPAPAAEPTRPAPRGGWPNGP